MSQELTATAPHPSHAVAVAIADLCPEALFCGFRVNRKADGTFAKLPVSKAGAGVGADIDHANLINGDELRTLTDPPNSAFWGIFMQNRMTYDPFGELVLTILDLDTKRSTAPRDIRMVKLMDLAKERGLLTERSHSKKGGHIIFLAWPDPSLPPQINLGNHQEIEIFGHPKSAGKNVMFTGDSMRGDVIELGCTVTEFLAEAGIQIPQPEVKKSAEGFDFSPLLNRHQTVPSDYDKALDALQYINPDADYDTWLAIGFSLHKEFGDRAKQDWMAWSLGRAKETSEADLEKHWKSFGKKEGVGIGTLFHTAKQAGWEPPTKASERRSAVDDFQNLLNPVSVATAELVGAPPTKPSRWQEVPLNLNQLEPVDYIIDGFLAHSFSVIAGQPGVGKTTAMLAVALIAAGFPIGDSSLKAEARRKIIYVSEDTAQVKRSLYAYAKHMRLDIDELQQYFVLVESIRSTADQVLELAHLVLQHTINDERPWLIIDTANATLDIENENDNSQVGAFMAALKQTIYTQLKTSITIITHTAKTMANTDDSAMARGASAYTGDATLTAVLFMDEEKNRYLRLVKTRYEPVFREIMLVSHIHHEAVMNRHGSMQEVNCVIVAPQASSEADRKQLQASKAEDKQQQKIQDKSDQVCAFIQSVINRHPEGVIIRKGSHVPKTPPAELQGCYQLQWDDVYQHVPGADKGEIRRAVGGAIFTRFAPDAGNNCWVQLG